MFPLCLLIPLLGSSQSGGDVPLKGRAVKWIIASDQPVKSIQSTSDSRRR
jgi:hypothetical protein